jgi:hypothetical protein
MRKHSLARFGRLYKFIDNGGICVYCGVPATSADHFVPLSVIDALSDVIADRKGLVLVPCCGQCNSIAGARMFNTIGAKRRYIQDRLRYKYRRHLECPRWSTEEVEELGWSLKTAILSAMAIRQWIEERLAWRNSQNPAAVRIAAIRSDLGVFGKGSARRAAKITSTRMSGPRR